MDDFYGSAAAFRTYHEDRGRDVSDYDDDAVIESALLVASEYVDGIMANSVCYSTRVGASAQLRLWPRVGALDRDGYAVSSATVPTAVEHATYEAALRELQTQGSLTVDYTPPKYKRVSVEGAVSVEYANVAAGDVQTQLPVIWRILGPLLGSRNSSPLSGSVVRA